MADNDRRVAVVTGAGGGLGAAAVDVLLGRGASVVAVDRESAALEALSGAVTRLAGDVSEPDAAAALFDRIAAEVGVPDIVVNTVGAYRPGEAIDTTAETLRFMLAVNLEVPWWVSQAAARHMRERGAGSIVHVAARDGIEPVAGAAAYGVSKAALVHLIRVLDVELRPAGIRVNAVVPKLIDTPANRANFPAAVMEKAVAPTATSTCSAE